MKWIARPTAFCLALLITGCGSYPPPGNAASSAREQLVTQVSYPARGATVLLVSLADGSVIKQMIATDADICFKQNSSSSTTCLTEGTPIVDAATNTIIGYRMIENHIDLIGRTD